MAANDHMYSALGHIIADTRRLTLILAQSQHSDVPPNHGGGLAAQKARDIHHVDYMVGPSSKTMEQQ